MPKASEICEVSAGGQKYTIWTAVEVHRSAQDVVDHALLTVAEISTNPTSFAALKLKPADLASITLAGRKAISGFVYLRQASADATQHGVQIGIATYVQGAMVETVDVKPGQYIDQTLQQIASSVLGKMTPPVTFSIVGNPKGSEIPFKRVSEHIGEEKFAFIERLCRMRNIHMIDDGQGGLVGFRGATKGGLVLEEGKNILHATLVLRNNESVEHVYMTTDSHQNDSGDANRNQDATASADPDVKRQAKLRAEMPAATQAEVQMRADQEADWVKFEMVDGEVTVPGWLTPDGSLWMEHVLETVTLKCPLVLPENSMEFMIKGVIHRQSSERGTTTSVLLCRFDGFGSGTGEPLAP